MSFRSKKAAISGRTQTMSRDAKALLVQVEIIRVSCTVKTKIRTLFFFVRSLCVLKVKQMPWIVEIPLLNSKIAVNQRDFNRFRSHAQQPFWRLCYNCFILHNQTVSRACVVLVRAISDTLEHLVNSTFILFSPYYFQNIFSFQLASIVQWSWALSYVCDVLDSSPTAWYWFF